MNVNTRNRAELKSYFIKNSIPTESNFVELIDGMLNQKDDGLVKLPDNPLSIEAAGDNTSEKKAINIYPSFGDRNPAWTINLNPRSAASDPTTTRSGFNISDGEGLSRLFIDRSSGSIGLSTITPVARLDIQQANRSGTHPAIVKGLYITADFGADNDGVEIRHSNGTQGIGFGFNTIYATGSDTNQDLGLKARGTGQVKIASPVEVNGTIKATGGLRIDGSTDHIETDGAFYRYSGQVYITVDDNLYIRDKGGEITAHFDTNKGALAIGATNPGSSRLKVVNSATDFADIYFAAAGSGQLQFAAWAQGWNINAKTDGKHLYLNRDAGENSNVLVGRVGKELFIRGSDGNVGLGSSAPAARLDIQQANRSGTHPTAVKGLYITGEFGADSDGVEFRHSNATQGIGFGYNTIYATGSNANQDLGLKARGTGQVKVISPMEVSGLIKAPSGLQVDGSTDHIEADGAFYRYGGQVYITVDDNLYIRDMNGEITAHFNTNNGRLGLGKTSPKATLDVEGEIRGKLWYSDEYTWTQGNGNVKMLHSDKGVAFLTYVQGKFEGGGEIVRVWIGSDGFWYLGGSSGQTAVTAKARCIGMP